LKVGGKNEYTERREIMTHNCNVCEREMTEVDDIDLQGFKIRGWRCECGNTHSNSDDVDVIVKSFQ